MPEFWILRARSDEVALDHVAREQHVFVIEESLGYLLNSAARLLARQLAHCLDHHGIPIGQWPVLLCLWAENGLSQTELSRQVAIDDATMVRTLDRMERDGLARRQRNAHDRRQINIFLTERGRGLRDVLIPCAVATNEAATQALTEDESQQLLRLLGRMITSLKLTSLGEHPQSEL